MTDKYRLAPWQQEFVDAYRARASAKSRLVAPTGSGKTVTALRLASDLLGAREVDKVIVLTDLVELRNQWQHVAADFGLDFDLDLDVVLAGGSTGTVLTTRLSDTDHLNLLKMSESDRLFVLVDEAHRAPASLVRLTDEILSANDANRALFVTSTPIGDDVFDSEFQFNLEMILAGSLISDHASVESVKLYSPSFALIRRLQQDRVNIDDLPWREFETLIAELLALDGYNVEQMRGTKDGGVDVIATRHDPAAGIFKTVWQAKKRAKGKVGLSTIRELADTQREHGASKAVIVTTTYLTRGALERVMRDRFTLGKVDRDDLEKWIQRQLR